MISSTRAARIIDRSDLDFEPLRDPRDRRGVRHEHAALLRLLVAGLASARPTARAIEDLSEDLSPAVRRTFGLKGIVSDTALYELVCRQEVEGFREVLWAQLRRDLERKAITNDLFPGGVLSIDGKGAGGGEGEKPIEACRQTVCDVKHTPVWHLYTLRSALTSSSARPYLDQEFINDKAWETLTFPKVLRRVADRFPKLFRYVTVDAGMTSAANAKEVLDLGKLYVFALKANLHRLYALAQREMAGAPVVASTTERAQGKTVTRELRRVPCPEDTRFPSATQLWAVRYVATADGGTTEAQERFFITAVPWDEISPDLILALVRLHWGIENGAHWTEDVVFAEDQRSPCRKGNGIAVVSWLRLLAYNLVAVFRSHLPKKDRLPRCWRRACELIYQAFLVHDPRLATATEA